MWTELAGAGPPVQPDNGMAALGSTLVLLNSSETEASSTPNPRQRPAHVGPLRRRVVPNPHADAGTLWGGSSRGRGDVAVLFGGAAVDDTATNQTWTWNGTAWSELTTAHSPPARFYASLATLGSQLVLFGGSTGLNGQMLGDT